MNSEFYYCLLVIFSLLNLEEIGFLNFMIKKKVGSWIVLESLLVLLM